MKFEFSAGGVVFKRGTTRSKKNESQNNAKIYVLVCQHSQHHGWVFPKGLIGLTSSSEQAKRETKSASAKSSGETKEAAALREVKEETGADAKILQPLTPTTFWYQFNGEKIKKTVYYFLMQYLGGDITKHDHEMEAVEWLPVEEVEKRLTYKSDKDVWKEAQQLVANS